MKELVNKIKDMADIIAKDYGVEIFDIELAGSQRRPVLRIFIDKDRGVTLEDCENFSRAISSLLDVEDPIKSAYVLEVSSPGLDRPLKKISDFEKSIGKLAKIITKDKIGTQNVFVGRIMQVSNGMISLDVKGRQIDVMFEQISKARLEIEIK